MSKSSEILKNELKREIKMKAITKLMILYILGICLSGCGDSGGRDDDVVVVEPVVVTPVFTYSKAEDLQTPFYCSGGRVSFDITHTGTCAYQFDLINKDTQTVQVNLATSSGNLNGRASVSLAKGDYFLSVTTLCPWKIDVYGNCQQYVDTSTTTTTSTGSGT